MKRKIDSFITKSTIYFYNIMEKFVKPRIVISKCIEFEYCRYNGQMIRNEFVKKNNAICRFYPGLP